MVFYLIYNQQKKKLLRTPINRVLLPALHLLKVRRDRPLFARVIREKPRKGSVLPPTPISAGVNTSWSNQPALSRSVTRKWKCSLLHVSRVPKKVPASRLPSISVCARARRFRVSVPRGDSDILISIFCLFDITRLIFCLFDILSFDILPFRYFVFRFVNFRYFATSILCYPIFCDFDILRFRYFAIPYFAISVFCFSIFCNCDIFPFRYSASDILSLRYFTFDILRFDILHFDILSGTRLTPPPVPSLISHSFHGIRRQL